MWYANPSHYPLAKITLKIMHFIKYNWYILFFIKSNTLNLIACLIGWMNRKWTIKCMWSLRMCCDISILLELFPVIRQKAVNIYISWRFFSFCSDLLHLGPPQTRVKKQQTRIKKQNGLAHLRFLVCVTPKQKKKHCLIRESSFQRNMCETANQQSISSHMVVYMACKMRCRCLTFRRCFVNRALSRNRSLRDAKPARHIFVWFAKHCLAEHCLLFRGDADECEKQFCFVFRICLAFFDSRLWRPLLDTHELTV